MIEIDLNEINLTLEQFNFMMSLTALILGALILGFVFLAISKLR